MMGSGGITAERACVSPQPNTRRHADGKRRCVNQRSESSAYQSGESDMKNVFIRFVREEEGQDVIEYGLLGAFISVVAAITIVAIGVDVQGMFTIIDDALIP
jgi:Flp pilus assembly pilin Flp